MVGLRPSLVTRQREPLVRCVPRFSAIALVSIGLLGVTGFFASWIQTGSLLELTSDYGRVLLVKLALAVGALAIGGLNFLYGDRLIPRLPRMRLRLVAEVSLGLAVLLATGLLSTTSPTDTARGVAIEPLPNAFGVLVPGMSLELLPGRPGVNQVAVTSEGAMGTANFALLLDRLDEGGQTRVTLRHVSGGGSMPGMPGMEHGASSEGPARFVADAVVLPASSDWDANVLLLSGPDGSELLRQRFSFELDDATVVRGQIASLVDGGAQHRGPPRGRRRVEHRPRPWRRPAAALRRDRLARRAGRRRRGGGRAGSGDRRTAPHRARLSSCPLASVAPRD